MKYLILLPILFFIGCSDHVCPVPKNLVETKYIKQPLPELQEKPEALEYKSIMVQFKGKDYFVVPKTEAVKMSSNWESFKSWAETNFDILKNMQ